MAINSLPNLQKYPDVANALGEMLIAWARMDGALIGALARTSGANLHQMQRGFHHLPTFETRIRFIRSLISEWPASGFDRDAIDKCIEKIGKLASARNHWVHGDWCDDTTQNLPVMFNHRTQQIATMTTVRAHDINSHVQAVRERTEELETLIRFSELVDAAAAPRNSYST